MKMYETNIIQHNILLNPNINPFRQKLRRMNLVLLPIIEKELEKLFPLRFYIWVSNLVHVRKKNGEIKLHVDFQNLNKASDKDNYPVPPME